MDLWALARYDLGLTDEEFGDMTYALFEAVLERKMERERKEFLRTGILAAAVINFSMCHPERMVSPEEFLPGGKEEEDLSKLPPEEQAARMMSMFSKKTYNR